nr:hypothetical protein [Tanacetum cinerariifolium]
LTADGLAALTLRGEMLGLGEGCRMKGLLRGNVDLDIAYGAMLGRVLESFGLTTLTVLAAVVSTGWDLEDMDLFSLIRTPNPTKVKTRSRPRVAHKVPLLTVTANRVIEMEDPAAATDSSGVPSIIERSPLDFATEAELKTREPWPWRCRLLKTYRPQEGKSLAAIELGMGSTRPAPVPESAPVDVSDPNPLSFADPRSRHPTDVASLPRALLWQEIKSLRMPPLFSWSGLLRVYTDLIQCEPGTAGGDGVAAATEVSEEEKLKAAFEEFKQYEDNRVEQRCAKMDARLDALSIDFDEELYPHMLTAIACRRWMTGHGLRLAVVKCSKSLELRRAFADVVFAGIAKGMSEGLRHGVETGRAQLDLEALEAYDPKAKAKYIMALQVLKNQKYPLVDQMEGLKDAPMDLIMVALYLESDTEDDASQRACKEEMLLADAITANVSRAEKKKKCRVVCRTHGVGSAHHAWSDGVPASVPTVIPQGLAICWRMQLHRRNLMKPFSCLGLARYLLCIVSIHSTACGVFVHTQHLGRMILRTQSSRPPGLQPVYAAGRV